MRALLLVVLVGCTRSSTSPAGWRASIEPSAPCVLTARAGLVPLEPERSQDVFLPGTSHAFARVTGAASRGRLWYPEGPRPERQPVELEDEGIVVRGSLASTAARLSATSAVTMDGHLATTASTPFQWQGVGPGGLQLSYDAPTGFTPLTPTRVSRTCEAMSLDPIDLPASGTRRTAEANGAQPMRLVGGRSIPLHGTAAGPVVGTFSSERERPVTAVARAVGWLRIIATDDPRYEIDGWIAEGDARPADTNAPGPTAAPSATTPTTPSIAPAIEPAGARLRCSAELRFAATEPDAPPRWSGIVRAGTWFAVLGDAGAEAVRLGVLRGAIQPSTPTSWVALRSEVAGCERRDAAP